MPNQSISKDRLANDIGGRGENCRRPLRTAARAEIVSHQTRFVMIFFSRGSKAF